MISDGKPHEFQSDLDAIGPITVIPAILEAISETTGMRFVVVARVTEGRWVACKVLDGIDFGLKEGSELIVETTICHEIRASYEAVAIDNVAESSYRTHHTPLQYGSRAISRCPSSNATAPFLEPCAQLILSQPRSITRRR